MAAGSSTRVVERQSPALLRISLTLAKGLAGGYQPIGAVLCSERVYDAFVAGSGAFVNGHTYSAHAIACAAALAVQRVIREEGLLDRVRVRGQYLRDRLIGRLGQHRCIGDIRGRGLLMALELVAERDGKTPFDPALKMHSRLKTVAMELGLLVYHGGGTIDGRRGDHVLLAPPYNVTEAELA